jgi:hypothetical protein
MALIQFANNATTTLAGSISNTSTSLNVAAGTGVLFPQVTTASGDYFVFSMTDAATQTLHEIMHVTNVAGDTFSIARAQEGTTGLNWNAGDIGANLWTAGSVEAVLAASRQLLSGNLNLYVNASTGSDSNNGLSSAAPLLTLQKAINILYQGYDLAGYTVTINATGAFTAGAFLAGLVPGSSGASGIVFDFAAGSSVTISSGDNFTCTGGGYSITGLVTITNTDSSAGNGYGLNAFSGGTILISSGSAVTFGACAGAHMVADGGYINIDGSYTISGNAPFHLFPFNGGIIQWPSESALTATLSGTPAFTAFAFANTQGLIFAPHTLVTFSGAASGSRYSVTLNSVINTEGGGANFFPGSSAGTTATGGQYA